MEENVVLLVELEELQRKLEDIPRQYRGRREELSRSLDSIDTLMAEKGLYQRFVPKELAGLEQGLAESRKNLERVNAYFEERERQKIVFLRREIEEESRLSCELLKHRVVSDKELKAKEKELGVLREEKEKLKTDGADIGAMGQHLMERYSDQMSGWDLLEGSLDIARVSREDLLREVAGVIGERIFQLEVEVSESEASLKAESGRSLITADKISQLTRMLEKEQRERRTRLAEQGEFNGAIEKLESRLYAVRSFQTKVEKSNAKRALLTKEFKEWVDIERPLIEERIAEIKQALHSVGPIITPGEGEKPEGEEKKAQAPKSAVTDLMPKIEERLENEVREKFSDLEKQHRELEARLREEEASRRKELLDKLKHEEETKKKEIEKKLREEEKALMAAKEAKQREEAERLEAEVASWQEKFTRIIQKKKLEFEERLKGWAAEQKKSLEERLKQEELSKRQELKAILAKEKEKMLERLKESAAQVARGGKKGEEKEKPHKVEVLELNTGARPEPPTVEQVVSIEEEAQPSSSVPENDGQGIPLINLADRRIEVKIRGMRETGILADLSPLSMNVLFNEITEQTRPGKILTRVVFRLPEGDAISSQVRVREVKPNPYPRHAFKYLFNLEFLDLTDSEIENIKQYIVRVLEENLKNEYIQVNSL